MDAIEKWDELVDDEMTRANARGEPIRRGDATRRLVKKEPEAHQAYLAEFNRRKNQQANRKK